TKSALLTVNPFAAAPLGAPTLIAPAADARFVRGQNVAFDWSDVSVAGSYTIQVSTSSTFGSTVVNQTVVASAFSTTTLPAANLVWRVRANDPAGTAGSFTAARALRVK